MKKRLIQLMNSSLYENNIAAVKIGNEVSSWFILNQELNRVVFYLHLYDWSF